MKVKDILKKKGDEVYSVNGDNLVCEALKLLNEKHVGALIVKKENQIQGIITERDILYKVFSVGGDIKGTKIKDIMTPADKLVKAAPDEEIEQIMDKMTSKKVRHIPIMTDHELHGLVSIGDIVKAMLFVAKAEKKILEEYISSAY